MNLLPQRQPKPKTLEKIPEAQFHDLNMIQNGYVDVGFQNLVAEILQLGSFVVAKLIVYRIVAHLLHENTYPRDTLQLGDQTVEIASRLLEVLSTIGLDSSEHLVTILVYLLERISDIAKARKKGKKYRFFVGLDFHYSI
ncbi:hypothetical protein L873DRAFT_1870688 [Choiromyces venosus 120613-1]|uniref:Uncharacterized protein n=1 Tax=Choiromyces venosus 120613-1 TaxID=1336337 RepID=A0A3N4JX33_9PEZI|nr:hypothetical protein L873DRAFT_1870688 [Choiromyces venosus 120613-1]